ncbi:MAG: hypothetical protein ABWZ76_09335 [Acidimicrobiales bacterium]
MSVRAAAPGPLAGIKVLDPDLGEHTDEALTAAGFTPDEISSLRAGSAVA